MEVESEEQLTLKVNLYRQQLHSVEELLIADPSNAQFLKLKDDFIQVITLTQNLISHLYKPVDVAQSNENKSPSIKADANPVGGSSSFKHTKTGAIAVGDIVEVQGAEKIYAGVVTGVVGDTEYKVKYFEYDGEVSLPLSSLTRVKPAGFARDEVTVGMKCECLFSQDRIFYEVVVTALTANGCVVTYVSYGNSEEVPIEYLRPAASIDQHVDDDLAPKNTKTGGTNTNKKWDGTSIIPIPESLKILPNDSEEEKQRKKKKLKAIKFKNKQVTETQEIVAVQSNWKNFVQKKTTSNKRNISGAGKIGESSLFGSSDDVNAKVGVTNSGRGMTTFDHRKKHKFDLQQIPGQFQDEG